MRPDREVREVADLVERHERRTAGRERVDGLARGPLARRVLEVPRGYVVQDHRPRDVVEGVLGSDIPARAADCHRHLPLKVDLVRRGRRDHDFSVRPDQRRAPLGKELWRLRDVTAELDRMRGVVEPEADDLLRVGDRRTELDLLDADRVAHRSQPSRCLA